MQTDLAKRGLLLLAFVLVTVGLAVLILLRRTGESPAETSARPELTVLAVANPGAGFPGHANWGALAVLGQQLPSSPGWQTRYQATLALALRGSTSLPMDVICQMLDEEQQMRNFRIPLPDGKSGPDEYAARQTVLNALKGIEQWHKHKDAVKAMGTNNPDLQRVYAAVGKLTESPSPAIKKAADDVKKKAASGEW